MESSLMIESGMQEVNLSEQCVLDCSGGGDCTGGWWGPAFDYFSKVREADEQHYAYTHTQGACRAPSNSGFLVANWDFVSRTGGDASVDDLKRALVAHGPLAVTITSTALFRAYRSGVFNELPDYYGRINHAVVIIGWDNDKQAWHIKNSWGRECWGQAGYGWVRYGANHIGYAAAWVSMKTN